MFRSSVSHNKSDAGEHTEQWTDGQGALQTENVFKMPKELRETMCVKPPTMRSRNTVYTNREAKSQAEVASNNKPKAKKRKVASMPPAKAEVASNNKPKAKKRKVASMPPAMVIPSAAPHGQFAVAPMPAIPTFPTQAVPSTAVTTAPAVATNAPPSAPQAPNVTKPGAALSTTDTTAAQQPESTAPPQLSSIQNAIQAFLNLEGPIPLLQPNTSSLSVTEPSAQQTPFSSQKSQSGTFMITVNQTGDDDDNESSADDSELLRKDSEQEEQEAAVIEEPVTEITNENREESSPEIEVLDIDDGASDKQVKKYECPYCNKLFTESVFFHHRKLHFLQKFFSCIMCNKNFRTEAGLETHRCVES